MLDESIFSKFSQRNAVKFCDSHQNWSLVTYGKLWRVIQIIARMLEGQNIEGQLIGVKLPQCPALITVLGGVIKSRNSFCCIDPRDREMRQDDCKECAAVFFPTGEWFQSGQGFQLLLSMRITGMKISLAVASFPVASSPVLGFCVRTSGTTGLPKTIFVPGQCIAPNVTSLIERFGVNEQDVIFVCSPPTFDPFVVDLLLALHTGATLLLVADEIRRSPTRLLPALFPAVTVMQMTPSMFLRWNHRAVTETILAPHSTLRVLVLGGEPFPALVIPAGCRTKVFNIYGITEVSCWSTIEHVTSHTTDQVPLGAPLDASIVLQVRSVDNGQILTPENAQGSIVGELFIGSSTRKCILLEEQPDTSHGDVVFRATGDLVELTNERRLLYRGRCCRLIKRFGCRVSLEELERVLTSHVSVEQCFAKAHDDDMRLVMFFKSSSADPLVEQKLWTFLRSHLPSEKLPDELLRIERFPLSVHGKVCQEGLTRLYLESQLHKSHPDPVVYFRTQLIAMGIGFVDDRSNKDDSRKHRNSFIESGGSSVAALRLYGSMTAKFPDLELPEILARLLDTNVSLDDAIAYVDAQVPKGNAAKRRRTSATDCVPPRIMDGGLLKTVCRYDLGKCIDSRPSTTFCPDIGPILSIGSHSGLLLTIDVTTNDVLSRITLPDRIECSVSFLEPFLEGPGLHAVVGCYDGFLYCFAPREGTIVWKYDAGGMIKSAPLVLSASGDIVFGSYGSAYNLHCLTMDGTARWMLLVGTKPILARPVALGSLADKKCVLVATLDGTMAAVELATGSLVWSRTNARNVPVFGSPIYLADHDRIVSCAVDGELGVYEATGGKKITSHQLPGNVFSSIASLKQADATVDLFVGCYDKHLHCVALDGDKIVLKWKLRLQSQIYATPLILDDKRTLIVCTTAGYVNVIDLRAETDDYTGCKIIATQKMDGELFATPTVCGDDALFVGCRDNFLYKLQINEMKPN
ncbi:beta-alanine-activating enzyme [Anopheles cruzii]|uniref:beta-alanine-activating enzyme n=1 Tax=Anopheles cruzii TaxID=68878 RepID=UPI0022EC93B0|nr:beta-alanine-activating enzyme [Anopheles cruzii]